jgi:hypothetical protein
MPDIYPPVAPCGNSLESASRQQSADASAGATEPAILRPYHASEAISVREAARLAGRTPRTIRLWAARYDLGRVICGQWRISVCALAMHLDGKHAALDRYLAGDRHSPEVVAYFRHCDVPLPRRSRAT